MLYSNIIMPIYYISYVLIGFVEIIDEIMLQLKRSALHVNYE